MSEINIIEQKPKLVVGMRRRAHYREIARMLPSLFEYALSQGARIVHKGPYEASGPAYERLFAWIEENGKELSGPIREAYLNDPREVGPEEILTVIYAPVS